MPLLDSDGLQAHSFEDAEVFLRTPATTWFLWLWLMCGSQKRADCKCRHGSTKYSPATKVIMMTGRETPAIRAAALEGGAFAFLVKPFDDEAFLCLVRRALRLAA